MTDIKDKATSRIPDFKTIEEEAEFWDTHGFDEFEGELEEVKDLEIAKVTSGKRVTINPNLRVPLGERAKSARVSVHSLMGWITHIWHSLSHSRRT